MPAELTILVADPNPHIRQFLKRELMRAGYKVLEATNYNDIFFSHHRRCTAQPDYF